MEATIKDLPMNSKSEGEGTAVSQAGTDPSLDSYWLAVAGVVPLLGLFPLLLVEAYRTWDRPHYRFAPIALVAALILIGLHFRSSRPSKMRLIAATTISLVGCLLGLIGTWFFIPAMAHAAIATTLFGWLYGQLGNTRVSRIFAIVSLVAIAIPLPYRLDVQIIQSLQSLSANWTSAALDTFGVYHWLDGGLLTGRYFSMTVNRVAGGVDSVFLFLGIALILVAVRRHGWVASALVVFAGFVWAVVYAIAVQTVIGLYGNSLETFSDTLPFTQVRAIVFSVVLICFVLFDIALVGLTRPSSWSNLTESDWLQDSAFRVDQTEGYSISQLPLLRAIVTSAATLLVAVGLMAAWQISVNFENAVGRRLVKSSQIESVTKLESLPDSIDGWTKIDFGLRASQNRGLLEYQWLYAKGLEQVRVSVTTTRASQQSLVGSMPQWKLTNASDSTEVQGVRILELTDATDHQAFLLAADLDVLGVTKPVLADANSGGSIWRSIFAKLKDTDSSDKMFAIQCAAFYAPIAKQQQVDASVVKFMDAVVNTFANGIKTAETPASESAASESAASESAAGSEANSEGLSNSPANE